MKKKNPQKKLRKKKEMEAFSKRKKRKTKRMHRSKN